MKEAYFEERGIAYRVSELRPERTTLVFIHGLSGSLSVWEPFEQYFEHNFNLVSMDLRGHGKSKRWPHAEDYRIELVGEDVALLLKKLGVQHFVLIGHSFGSLVALEVMRHLSIKKLVLLSAVYHFERIARTRLTKGLLSVAVGLLPAPKEKSGARTNYAEFFPTRDWDPRRIYTDVRNTGLATYLYCLDHIYKHTMDDDWAHVSVPTLIVHGKHDTYIPLSHAVELSRVIAHATLEILPNANHILVVNNIDEVSGIIESFLAASPAR